MPSLPFSDDRRRNEGKIQNINLFFQIIVGSEVFAKLQETNMKNYLKNFKLARCPKCHECWEHVEGKIDNKQKNDKGELLTP